jgi:hypothetical protein
VELDVATVDPELINAGNQMFLFWRKPVATILASRSLAFNDVHYIPPHRIEGLEERR